MENNLKQDESNLTLADELEILATATELEAQQQFTDKNNQLTTENSTTKNAETIESIEPQQPIVKTKKKIVAKVVKPAKKIVSNTKTIENSQKRNQYTCSLSDEEESYVKRIIEQLITDGFCENKADFLRKAIDYVINENAAHTILKKTGQTLCFPYVNTGETKVLKGSLMPDIFGFTTC